MRAVNKPADIYVMILRHRECARSSMEELFGSLKELYSIFVRLQFDWRGVGAWSLVLHIICRRLGYEVFSF